MTTFDDREKAAENKYAHDKEVEFRVHARRNKLLGQWAAAKMNLSGAAAEDYTKTLITSTVSEHDDEVVIDRLKADFSAKGIAMSEHDMREEVFRIAGIAREQINKE